MNPLKPFDVGVFCGVSGVLAGLMLGGAVRGWELKSRHARQMEDMRQAAIARNYAEHDRVSGRWQWIEPGTVEVKTMYKPDRLETETYRAKVCTLPVVK